MGNIKHIDGMDEYMFNSFGIAKFQKMKKANPKIGLSH